MAELHENSDNKNFVYTTNSKLIYCFILFLIISGLLVFLHNYNMRLYARSFFISIIFLFSIIYLFYILLQDVSIKITSHNVQVFKNKKAVFVAKIISKIDETAFSDTYTVEQFDNVKRISIFPLLLIDGEIFKASSFFMKKTGIEIESDV